MSRDTTVALQLDGVGVTRDGRDLLDGVDWSVHRDERWVLLGANGSGKTSLVRIAGLYEHPSRGEVRVLGERLGPTDVRRLMADDFAPLPDAALDDIIRSVFRHGRINLQRYRAGEGGYPYWHCELYPRDAGCETLHRHLLWTVYLNDDFQAGETECLYQQRKVPPRTGSLLIAPAAFTHTHRGNRPEGGDKYIATSWVLFNRAEQIFGKGA